jgi:SAM-dependent methyltransferase
MNEIIEFWKLHALDHIMPIRGEQEYPEGWEALTMMTDIIDGSVFEIGCGRGRLADLWEPHLYIGADICSEALKEAKKANPKHEFHDMDTLVDVDKSDFVLMYTVALHMTDDMLIEMFERAHGFGETLVVAEVMDPTKAKPNRMPPVFNRTRGDIVALAAQAGWELDEFQTADYDAYVDTKITFLVFE